MNRLKQASGYVLAGIGTIVLGAALAPAGRSVQGAPPVAEQGQTNARQWAPIELSFTGPFADEAGGSANPFLDYRLQVTFTSPTDRVFEVPGFFDGDQAGGGVGTVWKARFSADELGLWTWKASFRTGDEVAIELDPLAGVPTSFDGQSGTLMITAPEADAPGFLAHGRLEYVGEHHLQFQDGTWFLKAGTNSPENLLGYVGFDGVADQGGLPQGIVHTYAPHVADWNPGEPELGAASSPNGLKGIIGALNYLSEQGVNSVYFLPMNLGGDGQETAPFLSYQNTSWAKTHYDTSRLAQWNKVLEHATRRGFQLQFVLAETEEDNEDWLDGGQLGLERKLFFRELCARFSHNLGIKWNLAEENDYGIANLQAMADYLLAVDPYDHPICVHTRADNFSDYWPLLGDPRFSATSIQYTNELGGQWAEDWRANSAGAGRKWVVDLDENGTPEKGVDDQNAWKFRREVLYDVLFSGGGVEWYMGSQGLPVGGDQSVEDFRTREDMWRFSRIAREFLEDNLEFWRAEPADHLLVDESASYGGGEVFKVDKRDLAIYLPEASLGGRIDLTFAPGALFWSRWFDPRVGDFFGPPAYLVGGSLRSLGLPPYEPDSDWVVLLKRVELFADADQISASNPGPVTFTLDAGPEHADETYLMLGTMSGTVPGTELVGLTLPLNHDAWFEWTLTHLNTTVNSGFAGVLNGNGRGSAVLALGTVKVLPSLVGATLNHAYMAGPGLEPTWVSNPVSLKLLP